MRACDELEGRPKYQVMRFQLMAPMRAASTTICESAGRVTMPLPTVSATFWPANAPTMLSTAAMSRATRGERARVDTDVAMALAESWKPFGEVEREGDDDDGDEQEHQVFLSTMLSRMLATCSQSSMALSSVA